MLIFFLTKVLEELHVHVSAFLCDRNLVVIRG